MKTQGHKPMHLDAKASSNRRPERFSAVENVGPRKKSCIAEAKHACHLDRRVDPKALAPGVSVALGAAPGAFLLTCVCSRL